MNKEKLQSIAIILLGIALIITNIKMSSYVQDMDSLKNNIMEFHQLELEYFRLFCDELQQARSNYQQFLEAIQ